MPVILAGIAGGLVFLLARRFANPWVGLVTCLVWTTSPGNLRFLPSYLSQNTTVVLWLAGWWALARWLDGKRPGWLALLSTCIGWGILTRPFTMVGYAAAAALIVGREISRRANWRALALAMLPAACVLALIPIWSTSTTGSVWTTPYTLYSRIYFPYQRPGFGLPLAYEPQRPLPPDMARYGEWYRGLHAAHTWRAVPRELLDRLRGIFDDTWGGARRPLAFFAILGLFVLPREGLFAVATGALLVLSHVPFAHPWPWSVYYLEIQPSLAFVTALGLWAVIAMVTSRRWPERRAFPRTVTAVAALATLIVAIAFTVPAGRAVLRAREHRALDSAHQRRFQELVSAIPEERAIVFVRYKPDHDPHRSLIANEPDLTGAKAWIAYDRGLENSSLMALAPGRTAYIFDESAALLTRLENGSPPASPDLQKNP